MSTRATSPTPTPSGPSGRHPEGLLRPALVLFISLSLLTGLAYPALITGLAQAAFPEQARGSLVLRQGQAVGSRLIGQPFSEPGHFWGRLSATGPMGYNAGSSSGSNLGPSNPALRDAAQARITALRQADPSLRGPIPVDLVTASGSGLDPDISRAAADIQVKRVAKATGLSEAEIKALVAQHTEGPWLGWLGESRVNVLDLNLAIDNAQRQAISP